MDCERLIALLKEHDLECELDQLKDVFTGLREHLIEDRVYHLHGPNARMATFYSDKLAELLQIAWEDE